MKSAEPHQRVLLFDGVCNLCNSVIQFVIRNDKEEKLRFASLQSPFGINALNTHGLSADDLSTFIYIRKDKVHLRSTGFLYLCRDLGGAFRLFEVAWIIPRFVRDYVYDLVARSRYSMFGKRAECYVPSESMRHRFLEELPAS
ncbi:MAG: DCC1-like thiol-disulfide oxidoreductase family protein [Cryomorphaceae bacterium]